MRQYSLSTRIVLAIVCLVVVVKAATLFVVTDTSTHALAAIENSQATAKISGAFSFRSEVKQITNPTPSLANVGTTAKTQEYTIAGTIDESNQTATIIITNANRLILEMRKTRESTFVRNADNAPWKRVPSAAAVSQLNSLSFLQGIIDARTLTSAPNERTYGFDFSGKKFSDSFHRLLKTDENAGIQRSAEWITLSTSSELTQSVGQGKITVDSQGLPTHMELQLTFAGTRLTPSSTAIIKTVFRDYATSGLALRALLKQPLTMLGTYFGNEYAQIRWWALTVFTLLSIVSLAVVLHARYRELYLPIALIVVAMQVYQPFVNVPHKASAQPSSHRTVQEDSPPNDADNATAPRIFNPLKSLDTQHFGIAPAAVGTAQPKQTTTSTRSNGRTVGSADTDGDGLTNDQEALLRTDVSKVDTDSDGLTDPQEVQLGTNPTATDTDLDGISDLVEVTKFTLIGSNKYYLSPFDQDTNGDGVPDAFECASKLADTSANCEDSDGDYIPDFLDFDNDNDGIPDKYDITMNSGNQTVRTNADPYRLQISQTTTAVKPLIVEMQIVPTDPKLLYMNNATFDWPANDTIGQVQRVMNDTLSERLPYSAAIGDATGANGDMRVSALLEVRINISPSYRGNLPVLACNATNTCPAQTRYPNWLDVEKLRPYGISPSWSVDPVTGEKNFTQVTLTTPLISNVDASGTNVAYSAQMYYETGQAWQSGHEYRLQWIITALQDTCPSEIPAGETTVPTCTLTNRVPTSSIVQSYYSDWKLAGLNATEYYGYNAAVISEDATQVINQDAASRRLQLAKINLALRSFYLNSPVLNNVNTANPNESISTLFDNTRNTAAPTADLYHVDKSATKVATYSYPTPQKSMLINTVEIPKILNANLCSASAGVGCTSGTPSAAVAQSCVTSTAVKCRPGIILTTESIERTASLSATSNISFDTASQPTTIRSLSGVIYKMATTTDAGTTVWQPLQNDEIIQELGPMRATLADGAKPSDVSQANWASFQTGLMASSILNIINPLSRTYPNSLESSIDQRPSADYLDTALSNTWNDQIAKFTSAIGLNLSDLIFVAYGSSADEKKDRLSGSLTTAYLSANGIAGIANAIAQLKAIEAFAKNTKLNGLANLLFAGVLQTIALGVMIGMTIAQLAGNSLLTDSVVAARISMGFNAVSLTMYTVQLVQNLVVSYRALKASGDTLATAINAGKWGFASVSGTAAKVGKFLGYVGVGIAVAATWALAIYTAVKAEFPYQVGNAIAGAIGMTIAIIIVAVIAEIPVVGQIIAAIIGAIDVIAAIACSQLSAKDRRTTQSQWLCTGITGLIANVFTPYATNLLIDPSDAFSYIDEKSFDPPRLLNEAAGFSVGNSIQNTLVITDYIQRMPFPSTWMALPYFWQWNGLDPRNTAITYNLGTTQVDKSGDIGIGSQYSQWQSSSKSISDSSASNDGASFSNQKRSSYSFNAQLTTNLTGINSKLPDQILSRAFKTQQQNCFTIFIFFLFGGFLLPICYIGTQSQTKYTNLNETTPTQLDVFPATFEEFSTMRQEGTGYTFNWSPATASPAFPTFVDADNDGIKNTLETTYNTRDDRFDTDTDGVADIREVALGTNPLIIDTDADGLTDKEEIAYQTDPLRADSDGDGLLDGEEIVRVVKTFASPNGVRVGGWEVTYAMPVGGNTYTTWVGSDPRSADRDQDGVTDLRERVLGWSPYAKNSGDIVTAEGSLSEALTPMTAITNERANNADSVQTMIGGLGFRCTSCPTIFTEALTGIPAPSKPNSVMQFASGQSLTYVSATDDAFSSGFSIVAALKSTKADESLGTGSVIAELRNQFRLSKSGRSLVLELYKDSSPYFFGFSSGINLPVNSWERIGVTYDGSKVVFYQNGVEVSSAPMQGKLRAPTAGSTLSVGGTNGWTLPQNYWVGAMDNVAFYRSALTAKEMATAANGEFVSSNDLIVRPGDRVITQAKLTNKLLARTVQGTVSSFFASENTALPDPIRNAVALNASGTTTVGNIFEVPGRASQTTGTMLYKNTCVFAKNVFCARLDERSTTGATTTNVSFADVSSLSSDLRCGSICPLYDATHGWNFDTNNSLVTSASVGNAISSGDFTVALWVKPNGQATTYRPLLYGTVLQIGLANEYPQFKIGSQVLTGSSPLNLNQWYHLVFRQKNNIRSIWVNGVSQGQDAQQIVPSSTGFAALKVGSGAPSVYARSNIRDIQIYAQSLSDQQITVLSAGCDDPLLIVCLPMSGNTTQMKTDRSVFGSMSQPTFLLCSLCSAVGTTALQASTTVPTLQNGYAALITDHDFSLSVHLRVPSVTSTTLFSTGTAVGSGEKITLSVLNGTPTVTVGSRTVSAGAMSADTWSTIAIRQRGEKLSLRVYNDNAGTLSIQENTVTSRAVKAAQEPLSVGAALGAIDNIRMYRTAIDDQTLDAIARSNFYNTLEGAMNQAPVSDSLTHIIDARSTVIEPITTKYNTGCSYISIAVCLPFAGTTPSTNVSYRSNMTVTQSSIYGNMSVYQPASAIDGNLATTAITNYDFNPYLDLDLKQSKEVASVDVFKRADGWLNRYAGAMVVLRDTPFPACPAAGCTAAWYKSNAKVWKWLDCNSTASTCASSTYYAPEVSFPLGTTARYVRIVLANDSSQWLQIGEVNINGAVISCQDTGGCPPVSAGGTQFSAHAQRLSTTLSQNIFSGSNNYTFMTWLKWDGTYSDGSQLSMLLSNHVVKASGSQYMRFGIIQGKIFMWSGTGGRLETPIPSGEWVHAAFVRNGQSRQIYINGILATSDANGASVSDVGQMTIGSMDSRMYLSGTSTLSTASSMNYFNGKLRDFEIHASALSAAQIKVVSDTPAHTLQIPFDDFPGSTRFTDVITTGLSLNCVTLCPESGVPGQFDTAIRFIGNSPLSFTGVRDYMSYFFPSENNRGKTFALSMWVKPQQYNAALIGENNADNQLYLGIDENGYVTFRKIYTNKFNIWNWSDSSSGIQTNPIRSSIPLPLNQWSHIELSVDGNTQVLKVNDQTTSLGATYSLSSSNMTGRDPIIGKGYVGDLDNLIIRESPRETTSALVDRAPTWELNFENNGVITSNKLDTTSGITKTIPLTSVALPTENVVRPGFSRYQFSATCVGLSITGVECPVANVVGQEGIATSFNGSSTLLATTNSLENILSFSSPSNTRSIEFLVKPDNATGRQTILSYGTLASKSFEVILVEGKLFATILNGVSRDSVRSSATLPLAWNHVVVTMGPAGFKLYINGVLDINSTSSGVTIPGNVAARLYVGASVNAAGALIEPFRGSIDKISITDGAIPLKTIANNALALNSRAVTLLQSAKLTVDADLPVVQITLPPYVSRVPVQFVAATSDATSSLSRITYGTTNNAGVAVQSTASAPQCAETAAGSHVCPMFQVDQRPSVPVEGKYRVRVDAYDAVDNRGFSEQTLLVDTTPPIASLNNTSPYTTSVDTLTANRVLHLALTVNDPLLVNANSSPGSGVASVTVFVKDFANRLLTASGVTARKQSGSIWVADIPLPFTNPTGFYQVTAVATDSVGNPSSELVLAGIGAPVQVDDSAPHDTIVSPSPYAREQPTLGSGSFTGYVSDFNDGRPHLQKSMALRLDFESPDGSTTFDNRAVNRYFTECDTCPAVTADTVDTTKRVARFNIEGVNQSITAHNLESVLGGSFSFSARIKASDAGTIASMGKSTDARFRLRVNKSVSGLTVTATRAGKTITSPIFSANWNYLIYREFDNQMVLSVGETPASMTTTTLTIPAGPVRSTSAHVILGATQSDPINDTREDYFHGYIDDVIFSRDKLLPADLLGKELATGSAVSTHSTRLDLADDGMLGTDTLGTQATYYAPMNQNELPFVDAINGVKSNRCIGGFTAEPWTCPSITPGFATNAILFDSATDGLQSGNELTSTGTLSNTILFRVKIPQGTTSGLIASLQAPLTSTSNALFVHYDAVRQGITLTAMDNCSPTCAPLLITPAESFIPLDDAQWHVIGLQLAGVGTTNNVRVIIDDRVAFSKTIAGNIVGAKLGFGTLTNALLYPGRTVVTTAAVGVYLDDVAIFPQILSAPQLRDFAYGYSTVLHETFDEATVSPGFVLNDTSPFNNEQSLLSGDAKLTSVPGIVGQSALAFDGNDKLITRDDNARLFAAYDQPWSTSVWVEPKTVGATQTILRGMFDTYTYSVGLSNGRPTVTLAGTTLTASSQPTGRFHLAVSSDGTTLKIYVNGSTVATGSMLAGANPYPSNALKNIAPSGTATFNGVTTSLLSDNDLSTAVVPQTVDCGFGTTCVSGWTNDLGSSKPIDALVVHATQGLGQIWSRDMNVYLSDVRPADYRVASLRANAKWIYAVPGYVIDHKAIPVPAGITARYVTIAVVGAGRAHFAVSEIQIIQKPTLTVGTDFVGVLDDLRIYRRALTNDDLVHLGVTTWTTSTLDRANPRTDGYKWSRTIPAQLESVVSLQSTTTDLSGNNQQSSGEHNLWSGSIDTLAPRVSDALSANVFTVSVADNNLDTRTLKSPCGSALTIDTAAAPSLWARTAMSFLDGTYTSASRMSGGCELSPAPELIERQSQIVSRTTSLAYGRTDFYLGGRNRITLVNPADPANPNQPIITVDGDVESLVTDDFASRLYAIVKTRDARSLYIYDIETTPKSPVLLSTLALSVGSQTTIQELHITTVGASKFIVALDSASQQHLLSINVTSDRNPTQVGMTTLSGDHTYALAVNGFALALAQGEDGVALYQIDAEGTITYAFTYRTAGYSSFVYFNGFNLIIVDDDEDPATSDGNAPNTVRSLPVIVEDPVTSVQTLNSAAIENTPYVHTVPTTTNEFKSYHVYDILPALAGELLLLSRNSEDPTETRMTLVDMSAGNPILRSDAVTNFIKPYAAASNIYAVLVLDDVDGVSTTLYSYAITDQRLPFGACDIAQNCRRGTFSPTPPLRLGEDVPLQNFVQITNAAMTAITTTRDIEVYAESPDGVKNVKVLLDGAVVATWDASLPYRNVVSLSLPITAVSGIHGLRAAVTSGTDVTISSTERAYLVDTTAPRITITSPSVGAINYVNQFYVVTAELSDDTQVAGLSVWNSDTSEPMPFTAKQVANKWYVNILYADPNVHASVIPIRIVAWDKSGKSTTQTASIVIDSQPPMISRLRVTANRDRTEIPLVTDSTLTNPATAAVTVRWDSITDTTKIDISRVNYSIETIANTTTYTQTFATGVSTIPAGMSTPLRNTEASKVTVAMTVGDVNGNKQTTPLSTYFVDSPLTPDYTRFETTGTVNRNFLTNGCSVLGKDARTASDKPQSFAATWDAQALRLNWTGANWDTDGDLFIYLDTVPGGTAQSYRPTEFIKTASEGAASGDSFIALPINFAARPILATATLKSYVDSLQSSRIRAQMGRSTTNVEGADYVLHIEDNRTVTLKRWNGLEWTQTDQQVLARYEDTAKGKYTDVRIPFSQINYLKSTPIGMLAFAVNEKSLIPWASFPTTNPLGKVVNGQKVTITSLLNGYSWPALTDGMCALTSVRSPDALQIQASLVSSPIGATSRAIYESVNNADPDAISSIISATTNLCAVLITDPWCQTVAAYASNDLSGSALLDGLSNSLIATTAPVVGPNSSVSYTLSITNVTKTATKPLYALVQTYGGIWLADPLGGTVVSNGLYAYNTTTKGALSDYEILQIPAIPASTTVKYTIKTLIDTTKSRATATEFVKSSSLAKIEVRLTDAGTVNSVNQARTIEWLNAAMSIDAQGPAEVVPDNQTIVPSGKFVLTGRIRDASAISNVEVQFTNSATTTKSATCTVVLSSTWRCPVEVPSTGSVFRYRVRAADMYGQQRMWSPWYQSSIDRTKPELLFDSASAQLNSATYVGGSSITLSGVVSDTQSTAKVQVCDERDNSCTLISSAQPDSTLSTHVHSGTDSVPITARPCSTLPVTAYTAYPLDVVAPSLNQRVASIKVEVSATGVNGNDANLWLRSPSGTLVALVTSAREPATNLRVAFTDDAPTPSSLMTTVLITETTPFIRPDAPLAQVINEPISGRWVLYGCDRNDDANTVVINAVTVGFQSADVTRSTNAAWTYPLANTAGQDGVLRTLTFRAVDSGKNSSNPRSLNMRIDTVAPQLVVNPVFAAGQLYLRALQGSTDTLLSGTVSDGGSLSSLKMNVYNQSGNGVLVASIPANLTRAAAARSSEARFMTPEQRALTLDSYTWRVTPQSFLFSAGTYVIQLVATDLVGNTNTSASYQLTYDPVTAPQIINLVAGEGKQSSSTNISMQLSTGKGVTTVSAAVRLDDSIADVITDTNLLQYAADGTADAVAQAQIPSVLQSTGISQLGLSETSVGALDVNGTLRTWNRNPSDLTTQPMTQTNVLQFAYGATGNTNLLTLSHTGVITSYNALGVGTTASYPKAIAVAAGSDHNLAVLDTGNVVAWGGANANGQLDVPVGARAGVATVGAGDDISLALKTDGSVVAWGRSEIATVPVSAQSDITQIAVGDRHALALRVDGTLVAWGRGTELQTTLPISTTSVVQGVNDVIAIAAGGNTSAALLRDGTFLVWGSSAAPVRINDGMHMFAVARDGVLVSTAPVRRTLTETRQAARDFEPLTLNLAGLIPGRRYRIDVTASNGSGYLTKTIYVDTVRRLQHVYLPLVSDEN